MEEEQSGGVVAAAPQSNGTNNHHELYDSISQTNSEGAILQLASILKSKGISLSKTSNSTKEPTTNGSVVSSREGSSNEAPEGSNAENWPMDEEAAPPSSAFLKSVLGAGVF